MKLADHPNAGWAQKVRRRGPLGRAAQCERALSVL